MTREKLFGLAKYFNVSGQEEMTHAEKFEKYLVDHNCCVEYFTINKPLLLKDKCEFVDYFKLALEHEKKVTASLKSIYDIAIADKDTETQDFLDWYISEQTEEEYKHTVIIERFELFKNSASFLYKLDQELGKW